MGTRLAFARCQSLGIRSSRIFGLYIQGSLLSKISKESVLSRRGTKRLENMPKATKFPKEAPGIVRSLPEPQGT
jgi:hypothetical protein